MADIDLSKQSKKDFDNAERLYQDAISLGYSEADADALWRAPIKAKWAIINSKPDNFKDGNQLKAISDDFDQAQASAVNALSQGADRLTQVSSTASKWASMPKAESVLEQIRDARLEKINNPPPKMTEREKADRKVAYNAYVEAKANAEKDPDTYAAAAAALDAFDKSSLPNVTASNPQAELAQPFSDAAMQLLGGQINMPGKPHQATEAIAPRSIGKFFISGENGKPDLTNYAGGRKEADAAWALRNSDANIPLTIKKTGRVKVKSPDGNIGTIPEEQLQDALTQGYKQVQ